MNTEQIKEINTRLALIEAEMGRIRVIVREASEQPEGNSSEIPNSLDPNHYIPKVGEVVEVSHLGKTWWVRIFMEHKPKRKNGSFCVVSNHTTETYKKGFGYRESHFTLCRRLNGEIIEFGCDAKQEVPPTPNADNFEYIDLLPEGYEFCEKEMAEQWIKVKNPTEANLLGHIWQLNKRPFLAVIGEYRPIRKIQTASYAVDWSDAPEWADVHAWDANGRGYWYGIKVNDTRHEQRHVRRFILSGMTLPAGLDWKLSKTFRPQ